MRVVLLGRCFTYSKVHSIPLDQVGKFVQEGAPLGGIHSAPWAAKTESLVGGFDCLVNISLEEPED